MFPYFGRKQKIAGLFPAPRYPLVIEPFAGSLGYSLHWQPPKVLAWEADDRVVTLWRRLANMTAIPEPPAVGSLTDDLLVKLCSYSEHSLTSGVMTTTSRMVRDWEYVHRRALALQPYVQRAVSYYYGGYGNCPDVEATWFIDPPYQCANRRGYKYGASQMDYTLLGDWVKRRKGQVIVCEQEGANWLNFKPLVNVASHRGAVSREMVRIA